MQVYINRGIVLEQAIADILNEYIEDIGLNETFQNFHTHVTLRHPFAYLFLEAGAKAADHFPVVVVSTYDEDKPHELTDLPQIMQGTALDAVAFTKEDIETLVKTTEIVNSKEKKIPGLTIAVEKTRLQEVLDKLQEPESQVYGWSILSYRKDSISIEIWSENEQVKNQIYSDLNLFVLGRLRHVLIEKYPDFDIKLNEESIKGQRGGAWNIDFGVILAGGNLRFDINYRVEQIIIDTDMTGFPREIIIDGRDYVKG